MSPETLLNLSEVWLSWYWGLFESSFLRNRQMEWKRRIGHQKTPWILSYTTNKVLNRPINRLKPILLQEGVGLRKVVMVEKRWSLIRWQWWRLDIIYQFRINMNTFKNEMFWTINNFAFILHINNRLSLYLGWTSPQDKHDMVLLVSDLLDYSISECLPSLSFTFLNYNNLLLMRISFMSSHSQYSVQKKNTLISPMKQTSMGGWFNTQIILNFLVDIPKWRRNSDTLVHRKT